MTTKPLPLLVTDDLNSEDDSAARRSEAVRRYAVQMAKKLGTSIDLLHVDSLLVYPVDTSQYPTLFEKHSAATRRLLDKTAKQLKVPCRALFVEGQPVPKILELLSSGDTGYEMVVLGTHGRKGIGRVILGSTAEEIIRNARVPAMTIGPEAQAKAKDVKADAPLKILVSTVLGANSIRAEQYAMWLAQRTQAEVTILHSLREAFHPVIQTALATPTGAKRLRAVVEEARADALSKLQDRVGYFERNGVRAQAKLEEKSDRAAEGILGEAKRGKYTHLITGTHGRNLLTGAFFGSTARKLILGSPIPVITVRSLD